MSSPTSSSLSSALNPPLISLTSPSSPSSSLPPASPSSLRTHSAGRDAFESLSYSSSSSSPLPKVHFQQGTTTEDLDENAEVESPLSPPISSEIPHGNGNHEGWNLDHPSRSLDASSSSPKANPPASYSSSSSTSPSHPYSASDLTATMMKEFKDNLLKKLTRAFVTGFAVSLLCTSFSQAAAVASAKSGCFWVTATALYALAKPFFKNYVHKKESLNKVCSGGIAITATVYLSKAVGYKDLNTLKLFFILYSVSALAKHYIFDGEGVIAPSLN